MPAEDISAAMGISLAEVKAVISSVNPDIEVTEAEAKELKDILMDHARGNTYNSCAETSLQAAIYLHKTAHDDRKSKKNDNFSETMSLLKQKAADRMRIFEAEVISESHS
jgi:hypothetical protein